MKRRLIFKGANCLLMVFLLFFCFTKGRSQILVKSSYCEGMKITDCLEGHINEADIVFEGTVLSSEKYQDTDGAWKIKTTYRVEKIFKGKIESRTLTKIDDVEKIIKYFTDWYVEKNREYPRGVTPATSKAGTTSIVLGLYKSDSAKDIFEGQYGSDNLIYQLDYTNYPFPYGKEDNILHIANEISEISFKTATELYDFILAQPITKFTDITEKKFIKPSFEQWKKIKKKSEKNGSEEKDGQNVLEKDSNGPSISCFTLSPKFPNRSLTHLCTDSSFSFSSLPCSAPATC